jgi:4'-phosphopantetheinyl transferase
MSDTDSHSHGHLAGRRSEVVAWTQATEALDARRMAALEAMLDPGERARAHRFTFAADRRDFVAAHGLLKEMVGRWLGLPPSRLRMLADAPGAKPRLIAPPGCAGLDVSISHCRGLVAGIGGFGCSVGIDAESFDARTFGGEIGPSLAKELFSREEIRWLRSRPTTTSASLLRLWTLKEALAKADGGGLGIGLHRCIVLPDPPRLLRLPARMGPVSAWMLRQWNPMPRHVVALACRVPEGEARSLDIVNLQ